MRFRSTLSILVMALLGMFVLQSCQEDSSLVGEVPTPPQLTLDEAVTINSDGSFSYELTGAQISAIVESEGELIGPATPEQIVEAFNGMVVERVNRKLGIEIPKTSDVVKGGTVALLSQVITQILPSDPPNLWIFVADGLGGLVPGVSPATTKTATFSRTASSVFLMTAYANVYSSFGNGIVSANDSSFDKPCGATKFCPSPFYRGTGVTTLTAAGQFEVTAEVRCIKKCIAVEAEVELPSKE